MPDDDKTRILQGQPKLVGPPPGAEPDQAAAPEEATRVLTAPAGGKPGTEPMSKPVDKIVFTCPNGHQIVAGGHLAGKRGKCSKCGVDVKIPGAATEPTAAAAPPPRPAAAGDQPVSAPAAAVGDLPFAGFPPLPSAAANDEGEAASDDEPGAAAEESPVGWDFVGAGAVEETIPSPGDERLAVLGEQASEVGDWSAIDPGGLFDDEGANPTAHLVARLWAERQHGGVIELHLSGGSVILPSYFDPAWSRGTHGLFGKEELDGSYTLTAVAWGTVEKVIVRQLTAVPPDMFP